MTRKRYILVDEPYYTDGGVATSDYRDRRAPGIGDVVTAARTDAHVDSDGDRLVDFGDDAFYVNAGILVDIEDVIRERTAAKTDETAEGGPSVGETFDANRTAKPVTLAAKVIRPTVLAELLTDIGIDDSTAEELVALAVLRSADDGIPFPALANLARLRRLRPVSDEPLAEWERELLG